MDKHKSSSFVTLSFEKTSLPPFEDILVLGNDCPLGMNGVGQCLDLLVPDGYDRHEVDDDHVAAVIINKNIIRRMSAEKVIKLLQERVFPFVGSREIIKVDFKVRIAYQSFPVDMD
ncbi:MAG: hypothetical protein ABIJ59_11240 [Pseudomonadota bacterium]